MPNIIVELADVENSISRPVIVEVVRQLCAITGINPAIKIMYPGDQNESYNKGTTTGEVGSLEGRTKLPTTDQIAIEVNETTFNESMILSHANRTDNIPFFLDNKLHVLVRPVKAPTEVNLTINYRTASKSDAIQWKNRMETKFMTYGDINLHTASYHYQVPLWVMDVLAEVHTLREAVEPYSEDFASYLSTHMTSQATAVTALDGKGVALAIAETQIRIQGLYDFTVAPEKADRNEDTASWVTTFTYKFTYDKPISVNCKYPVMVHNQLMDERYIPKDNAPNLDNHRKAFSLSGNALHYFESTNEVYRFKDVDKVITIPPFDEFRPTSVVGSTKTVLTALINVDMDNRKDIFNVADMGDYDLDSDVLDFIKDSEWRYLTVPYKTMFHVSLYKNDQLLRSQGIKVNSDLSITSLTDLNPRDRHQIRLAIVDDIDSIDIEALKRMKKHPKALVKIILAMGTSMAQLKLIAQRVDLTHYLKDYLPNTGLPMDYINKHRYQHNTVQSHYIVIGQRSDSIDPMHTTIGNGYANSKR